VLLGINYQLLRKKLAISKEIASKKIETKFHTRQQFKDNEAKEELQHLRHAMMLPVQVIHHHSADGFLGQI